MEENEKRDEELAIENRGNNSSNANTNSSSKNRKERRKAWAYVKGSAAKKLNLFLTICSLGAALVILIMFFLPVVKVENVSLGNYYSFAKIRLNSYLSGIDFLSIDAGHSELYISSLPISATTSLMLIILDVILLYRGIKYGIEYLNGSEVCIKKKTGKARVVFQIVISSLLVLSVILTAIVDKKLYSCKSDGMIIIALLLALAPFATLFIKREFIKNAEGVTKEKVHYLVVEKGNKKDEKDIVEQKDLVERSFIEWILGAIAVVGTIFIVASLNGWFGNSDILYSAVGKKESYGSITYGVDGEEIARLDFGETEELKDKYYIEWGKNFYFYSFHIKELEKELQTLSVEDMLKDSEDMEKAFEQYEKEVAKLENKISVLRRAISNSPVPLHTFCTEETEDGKYVVTEYIYNTNRMDKTEYKYGSFKLDPVALAKESISLDKTEFSKDTDFLKEKIVATITYADASVKEILVTPENAEELNNADRGVHLFKWSDTWGDYAVEIVIN